MFEIIYEKEVIFVVWENNSIIKFFYVEVYFIILYFLIIYKFWSFMLSLWFCFKLEFFIFWFVEEKIEGELNRLFKCVG